MHRRQFYFVVYSVSIAFLGFRLHAWQYLFAEEATSVFRGDNVLCAVERYTHAGFMALLGAKRCGKGDLIVKLVFFDQVLKGRDDIVGTLEMAGAADADGKLRHALCPPFFV